MTLHRVCLLLPLFLTLVPAVHAQAPQGDPFETRIRAGEAAMRSGLPLEAAREFGAAAALHPNDPAAHYVLAGVLEKAGRPEQAMAEYRKTIRLDPADAAAHNALAMLLEDQGRTGEALAQYRQAVALSPNDVRLRANLAGLEPTPAQAPTLPKREGGLGSSRRVRPLPGGFDRGKLPQNGPTPRPPSQPALPFRGGSDLSRGGLLAAGRLPEAEAAFRALLAHGPNDADARLRLGIVLYAQGRTAPARREWTRVLLSGCDPEAARRARRLLNAYP